MNEKKKPILGQEAVTDARTLGTPRMLILGLQHLFAMFGATVLVPILVQGYGLPLSIQTTLLMAGLGTLLFHVCTKFKVPAFLGSSFAYLGGFSTVASMPAYDGLAPEMRQSMNQYGDTPDAKRKLKMEEPQANDMAAGIVGFQIPDDPNNDFDDRARAVL